MMVKQGVHIRYSSLLFYILIVASTAGAGEIVIVDLPPSSVNYLAPAGGGFSLQGERESENRIDNARKQTGRSNMSDQIRILNSPDNRLTVREQAEQQSQRAQKYTQPNQVGNEGADAVTIILRAAPPLSDAEKARKKARAYAIPEAIASRDCSTVKNQVGMIGEGDSAKISANSVEKGGVAVNQGCK
jgi:hypothetical protein